ncbi:MAG: class I SAM-dependent methyltransferase [Candidatus Elarobacter sp.]
MTPREHWDGVFRAKPDRFGFGPSDSAKVAAQAFARVPHPYVLDLGSGSGRDTLFFAERGMPVVALDFSAVALDALRIEARSRGIAQAVQTVQHDVRETLPFPDSTFDACYAHMLFCMDFTLAELTALFVDVRRTLKPGGILVYTARTTDDPDFGAGVHRGEQRYEDEGFAVHFFDRRMVERLGVGFCLLDLTEFEEGALPRRLFTATLQKTP